MANRLVNGGLTVGQLIAALRELPPELPVVGAAEDGTAQVLPITDVQVILKEDYGIWSFAPGTWDKARLSGDERCIGVWLRVRRRGHVAG